MTETKRRGRPPKTKTETKGTEMKQIVDFHYLKRTVGVQATPDGTMDGNMFDMAVKSYLDEGWHILNSFFVGQNKDSQQNVIGDQYAFFLVKYA